jgi:hypothetical protein
MTRQRHSQELIPRQWALHQLEDPFVDCGLAKLFVGAHIPELLTHRMIGRLVSPTGTADRVDCVALSTTSPT